MKNWMEYFYDLQGKECQCGKPKQPKKSFCPSCYKKLPLNLQSDIYKRIGEGYQEAFDASVEYLNK